MKVLFVSSGNKRFGISPIVKNQGEALKKEGVDLYYFGIRGKGLIGYLSSIKELKHIINDVKPNIVHAHYSLSGYIAALAKAKPLVVSLMGSDVKSQFYFRFILWVFNKFFWAITIVKSSDMKQSLKFKDVYIIPNGVDTSKFKPLCKNECQDKLHWDSNRLNILFAANPSKKVKNYTLAKNSVAKLRNNNIKLHTLTDIPHNEIPMIMNAADVVLLTSFWEGSPNVIKEAMACNKPIVATDVGDIKWIFDNVEGCFVCCFDECDVAEKLKRAIEFSTSKNHTAGLSKINEQGLDSVKTSQKLIKIYNELIEEIEK